MNKRFEEATSLISSSVQPSYPNYGITQLKAQLQSQQIQIQHLNKTNEQSLAKIQLLMAENTKLQQ